MLPEIALVQYALYVSFVIYSVSIIRVFQKTPRDLLTRLSKMCLKKGFAGLDSQEVLLEAHEVATGDGCCCCCWSGGMANALSSNDFYLTSSKNARNMSDRSSCEKNEIVSASSLPSKIRTIVSLAQADHSCTIVFCTVRPFRTSIFSSSEVGVTSRTRRRPRLYFHHKQLHQFG